MIRKVSVILVLLVCFQLRASVISTDKDSVMTNTKIDRLDGIGKIIASGPLISNEKPTNSLSSYKLVSLFDHKGDLYDTQLYVTTTFSDWAYLDKGTSYGRPIVVTPIKKDLSCKLNPCAYLETVAVHFKEFSSLIDEVDKPGMFRFKLTGKSTEREYVIPRSYIKGFVQAVNLNKDTIKQQAMQMGKEATRLKASID